jgi:hypothetical protein
MDLNRLYFDHQLLIIRSARTTTLPGCENRQRAARVAARIVQIQKALGAPAARDWQNLAEQVA